MNIFEGEEHSFSRFLFISLVLHAVIFFTYPKWSSLLVSDIPSLERGGAIQVMSVDVSPSRTPSPVTNRASQTTVPRVTEPRPTSEPATEQSVTPVVPEVEAPVLPQPRPRPEPEPTPLPQPEQVEPDPTPVPAPEVPVNEQPAENEPNEAVRAETEQVEQEQAELLTSEHGTEIAIREAEPEPRQEVTPAREENPTPEPLPEAQITPTSPQQDFGLSGSGTTEVGGEHDDAGVQSSGSGEAEQAPPPPPPPPSGRALHAGGGSPIYPKNAEHDGVEGIVLLEVTVSSTGQTIAVRVKESSGDSRLDEQAKRTIEQLWKFREAQFDYLLDLQVEFARVVEGGVVHFNANVDFGEVEWLNAD